MSKSYLGGRNRQERQCFQSEQGTAVERDRKEKEVFSGRKRHCLGARGAARKGRAVPRDCTAEAEVIVRQRHICTEVSVQPLREPLGLLGGRVDIDPPHLVHTA